MISKKLEQLKTFLQKEGGGGGNGGGGNGGDGGGIGGTVFTVESSGFVPTYGGGKVKKPKKKNIKKNSPESFAEELMKFALDKSLELKKNMALGIGHKDMRNTDLGQSSRSGDNRKYTRTATVGGKNQYKVLNPPEIPFEHDAVLNWEDIFQKAETDDLQITAKVLIRDESNKVLILKDRFSDWWDLPGGHIHTDETPEEGALREVEEETGIKLNEVDLVVGQEVDTDLGHKLGLFLVAYVPLDSPKPLLSDEHTDYAWINMETTYYYKLGVWGPIIRYILRFMFEGPHEEDNPYVETQSAALERLDKAMVIHTDESGDKTALASGGVYLVKSDGKVFKQEPWPASEETGDLLNIEEDDFLDKKWILDKWKDQPIPMQLYRPVNKEHQNIISSPFKILLGTPDKYVVAEPPAPNSSEVLDDLEQVQMDFRYLSDRGKDRLEEVVNKADTTLLRPFMEYARDHGIRVDLYESLLEDILEDVNTIVMDKKYKINYPRPWQYEMDDPYFIYDVVNAIRPSIDTPSYPSGHSTQALVVAEILGNIYPNHLENFREIADDIGINRVKAGWHFPMDHTAGKKLALEIVDTLPDSMELEKDRVYLKPGQEAPEGAKVETGPAGGRYYDAEVDASLEELEGAGRGEPDTYESVYSEGPDDVEGRVPGETTEFKKDQNRFRRESEVYNISPWSPDSDYAQDILKSIGMDVDEYSQKWQPFDMDDPDTDPFDVFNTPEDMKFLGNWVANSLRDDAIYLQYASANLFGSSADRLDKVKKHFQETDDVYGDGGYTESYGQTWQEELEEEEDWSTPVQRNPNTPDHKAAREYAEATYANTQRSFEERGITHVKLYRGVETKGQVAVKHGDRVATKDLPLSSWSAAPQKAKPFGDVVVSRTFDVKDIFASCVDSLPADEFEFIVHTPDVGFEGTIEHVRDRNLFRR